MLTLLFTPHGVSFLDETASSKIEQHFDEESPGKRKRSYRDRIQDLQLSDELLLDAFLRNVTGSRDCTWSKDNPACQWRNVTCNKEGRVSEIRWNTQKLQGTLHWESLPSTIENLTLNNKDYVTSDLCGTINLSVLPRGLKCIHILKIKFGGSLVLTALPPQLEELMIYQTNLSGSLDLTRLPPTLTKLVLSHNKFSGPVDLNHIPKKLEALALDHNQLNGTISLVRLSKRLKILLLERNHLEGLLSLDHLPRSLNRLELSGNRFTGSISLARLPKNLEILALDHNQLTGAISLKHLPSKFSWLTLQNNLLCGVVDLRPLLDSSTKESKVTLHLEDNAFSGYLPKGNIPEKIYYGSQKMSLSPVESSDESDEISTEMTDEETSTECRKKSAHIPCRIA